MAESATGDEQVGDRCGDTVGGRWRLGRLLGSGGMASVYEATNEAGERAAVKLLHPEMARRKELKERFLREAYVANRIGHPSVVKILAHADGADVFLVLELLEGESLGARLQRASELTVRDLLGYTDQILDALGAAHAAGVIHRDIKPDNVFVTTSAGIKILDFGIARVIDDVPQEFKTRTGLALGTIPYMAPEQALGRRAKVDGRTDLFALGSLMFRALAGRRIHEEPSEAELLVAMATKPAPRLAEVAPNVPSAVCSIVDRALAFSQEARYPDAATMQADVRAVLAGGVPPYATAALGKADEATRVGPAAAGAAALSARDAPTVATAAPGVHERTLESVAMPEPAPQSAFAPTPAAFVSEAVPASLPAQSLARPMLAPTQKKRGGLVALMAFALSGVLVLGAIGVAVALLRPWEARQESGAGSEVPNIAISTAGPSPNPGAPGASGVGTSGAEPAEPAEPAAPAAAATTPGGAAAPAATAPAPTSPGAPAAPAPTAPAPAATSSGAKSASPAAPTPPPPTSPPPKPAATPPPAPTAPPPPTSPPPGPGKGHGKDKDKDKGSKKSK